MPSASGLVSSWIRTRQEPVAGDDCPAGQSWRHPPWQAAPTNCRGAGALDHFHQEQIHDHDRHHDAEESRAQRLNAKIGRERRKRNAASRCSDRESTGATPRLPCLPPRHYEQDMTTRVRASPRRLLGLASLIILVAVPSRTENGWRANPTQSGKGQPTGGCPLQGLLQAHAVRVIRDGGWPIGEDPQDSHLARQHI